ncbi:metallophosphatase [Fulvivirga maritima]|uniref:bifunctional metallophosphatase/5'-nucleotidase n=1 Tax=Fulvivirga maritima TaxID=2904247 RepID=UPI001F1D869E|nr:metallophosphatase [Fulvivirga maritima]UII25826.1 metallophosphatase [Fulvivirga maritima]
MKRRQFIIRSLAASALVSPFALGSCNFGLKGKKLTILHTNDMHSHVDPFDEGKYKGLGGMAARATAINKIRAAEDNVMLLDVGDVFQGTPYFNMFGGELELKLMSEMGYDATTIGNHEFDNGVDSLHTVMQYADFPYLCANYDFSRNSIGKSVQPYKIFDKQGFKVGVFGLGIELEGLVNSSMYGNTVYEDPIAVAKEMVQELKKAKCDLIICLSHLGYDYGSSPKPSDKVLAQEVSEIDVILGGHTHTFMEKPLLLTNADGFTTIINQVGWAGINLGRIDVEFTPKGKELVAFSPITLSNKMV